MSARVDFWSGWTPTPKPRLPSKADFDNLIRFIAEEWGPSDEREDAIVSLMNAVECVKRLVHKDDANVTIDDAEAE